MGVSLGVELEDIVFFVKYKREIQDLDCSVGGG